VTHCLRCWKLCTLFLRKTRLDIASTVKGPFRIEGLILHIKQNNIYNYTQEIFFQDIHSTNLVSCSKCPHMVLEV
jgi:hypothetical protein